jgi:hypothetical protein
VTFDDGTPATKDQMAKDVSAFLMWAAEPNLDRRHASGIAVMIFLILGVCGMKPSDEPWVRISQFCSAYYFAHFLIILPLVSIFERTLPLPNSISESVLHGEAAEAAPIGSKA